MGYWDWHKSSGECEWVSEPPYTEKPIKIYPDNVDSIKNASDFAAWTWDTPIQIVPVDTITEDFIIVGAAIKLDLDKGREWQIALTKGAGVGTVIANISGSCLEEIAGTGINSQVFMFPIPIKIAANTRISFKTTDSFDSACDYHIKIYYIELPL